MTQNETVAQVIDIRIRLMQKAIRDHRFTSMNQYETYKKRLGLTDLEMKQCLELFKVS